MSIKTDAKTVLANALRDLLKVKSFENITVENILEKSGASRATFYRHFEDKYSLMHWVYKARVDEIVSNNFDPPNGINILIESARFMKENEDYFSQINKFDGQNSFMDFIYTYVRNVTLERLNTYLGKENVTYEMLFALDFYCGGVISVISHWLNTGLKDSPEKIGKMIFDCIPPQVKIDL